MKLSIAFKRNILVLTSFLLAFELSAFSSSASRANRKTALRCLTGAENFVSEKKWAECELQVRLGLSYDDSVSDLWYMLALSSAAIGKQKKEVVQFLEKSFQKNNWLNYNRDNARLLYADVLSETEGYAECLKILDAEPFLYSADAEYIRTKVYYRLGDDESRAKARNKVDGARRIYPGDVRFPLVFFQYEDPDDNNADVRRLADYFVEQTAKNDANATECNAEYEILAVLFARDDMKVKLAKSFGARGLRHPLYAGVALSLNLFSEKEAFEYITTFADESIRYSFLMPLIGTLKEECVLESCRAYLLAYSGEISRDTDGDGIDNLFVKYERGRPSLITYDENQDDDIEWELKCDFGVPETGYFKNQNVLFSWDVFPCLSKVEYFCSDCAVSRNEKPSKVFVLNEGELKWSPVSMMKDSGIDENLGLEFFYPELNVCGSIMKDSLIASTSRFSLIPQGKENEEIVFMMIDGCVKSASYYDDGKLYAESQFVDNVPKIRLVDADGDGVFETTEFYDIDAERKIDVHSLEDERSIMRNLFGVPSEGAEFYLRMVQVDLDRDSVPDFTEEYIEHGGKITSWDTDRNGEWNVRHVLFPATDNEFGKASDVVEQSMFLDAVTSKPIVVTSVNGVPVDVRTESEMLSVKKDETVDFYWLTKKKDDFSGVNVSEFALAMKNELDALGKQGESTIVHFGDKYAMCIRVGKFDYGIIVENITALNSKDDVRKK